MIIDAHVHAQLNNPFSADALVKAADSVEIDKMCLLGNGTAFGLHPDEKQVKVINDFTVECVKKYPDRFFGFCFINPENDRDFIKSEVARLLREEKFRGIKMALSVVCRDLKVHYIMELARKFTVPVIFHCAYKTIDKFPDESDPSDVAYIASEFPDVTVVMPHIGSCGRKGILEIAEKHNVYVDTSGAQPTSGITEFAVETLGPERVMYGSDAPVRDFSAQLGRVYGAALPAEVKDKILGLNILNII